MSAEFLLYLRSLFQQPDDTQRSSQAQSGLGHLCDLPPAGTRTWTAFSSHHCRSLATCLPRSGPDPTSLADTTVPE